MFTFESTITLGGLIQMVGLFTLALTGWFAFKSFMTIRLEGFQKDLEKHAQSLQTYAERLGRLEGHLLDVIKELNKVVGRLDGQRSHDG